MGVARVIRRPNYTAETAAVRISALLKSRRVRTRAAEVGEVLRQEDGLRVACDALEALGAGAGRSADRGWS
jgi:UDP:flavonoid glycosyltransferase YjiC (YdhE family)